MNFRLVWVGSDDEQPEPRPLAERVASAERPLPMRTMYQQVGSEMVRCERLANGGLKSIAVANFSARIVRDLVLGEDTDQRRDLGIEAELGGQRFAFVVSAAEFGRMSWVFQKLGPQAIIYPGQQQHARAAIQWLSRSIPQEQVFTHLGWRKHGSDWVYLHAGGAVGAQGLRADLWVELPVALRHYQIQSTADRQEQVNAVRASLGCLSLAPDRISFPLLAAVYRAALGNVDFSVFLTGQTGTFKTALAAICQQHFGAAMDAGRLPANFASTANALETLAFYAKDALLVVDDFVPVEGSGYSILQGLAEGLFRSTGNQQGRSRMRGDRHLDATHPPRGLVLATGEEVPRGRSIRARLLIAELQRGDVDQAVLSQCQIAAQKGQMAAAMGAFLTWMAGQYDDLQQRLHAGSRELRSQNQAGAVHFRLPGILAELQSAWKIWLEFAHEIGAIETVERTQLERRNQIALQELAEFQIPYHHASDPALHFLALLKAALSDGRAYIADRHGKTPESPELWGWRRKPTGRGWVAQGTRIGWIANSNLFLEPMASYQVAQHAAGAERLALSEQALRHRLRKHGVLATIDAGRQMLLVRRTLEGHPRQVLHLKAGVLNSP